MQLVRFSTVDEDGFSKAIHRIKAYCSTHPCTVGGIEILAGAGLIAAGIKLGAIELGVNIVGAGVEKFDLHSLAGPASGGLSGTAVGLIGNVGVAAGGSAFAIPAYLLAVTGAAVGAFSGYEIEEQIRSFFAGAPNLVECVALGSMLTVGIALIIDGCRRILRSESFKTLCSELKDEFIYLTDLSSKRVSYSENELKSVLNLKLVGISTIVTSTSVGASIGAGIASSTVTVMGSHAIGGVALSLGLVSAPIWPVIACGAGGAALGYGAWKLLKSIQPASDKPKSLLLVPAKV